MENSGSRRSRLSKEICGVSEVRYHSQKIKIECGGVARTETRALITYADFDFGGRRMISTSDGLLAFGGSMRGGRDSLNVMAVKSERDSPLIGVGEIVDRVGRNALEIGELSRKIAWETWWSEDGDR